MYNYNCDHVEKSNKSFKTPRFSFCAIQELQLLIFERKEIPPSGILALLRQWDFCCSLPRGQELEVVSAVCEPFSPSLGWCAGAGINLVLE